MSMWRILVAAVASAQATVAPGHFLFMPTAYSQTSVWGSVSVLVQRGLGADGTASVAVSSRDGSALQSIHYIPIVNQTLGWSDGDSNPVEVQVRFAATPTNQDVTFFLDLHDATTSIYMPQATAEITIRATNVYPGDITFSANSTSFTIPPTWNPQTPYPLSIPVHRLHGAFGHVQVPYDVVVTATSTATAGEDFNFVKGLPFARFMSWSDSDHGPKYIDLLWLNQAPYRQDLTFTLQLFAPTGQALLGTISTVDITVQGNHLGVPAGVLQLNAPCFPSCAADVYSVQAGSAVRIYVARQEGTVGAIAVSYLCVSLIPGQPQTGTLTWADGDAAEKSFVLATAATSPTGTPHLVVLQAPTNGATLSTTAATTIVTVLPLEPYAGGVVDFVSITTEERLLRLSPVTSDLLQLLPEVDYWDSRIGLAKPVQVTAPGSFSVLVQRSRGSVGAATVYVQTIDGTAIGGIDFVAQTSALQWQDGDTRPVSVTVTILAPPYTALNPSRAFSLVLTTPTNTRLGAFAQLPLVIRGAMQTPRLVSSVLNMSAKTLTLTFSHPIASAAVTLLSILNPQTNTKITLTSDSLVVPVSPTTVVQIQVGANDFVRLQQAPTVATTAATAALSFEPGFANYDNLQCKSTRIQGCWQPLMLPQSPILVTTFVADVVGPSLSQFTYDQQYIQLRFSKVMDRSTFQFMHLCDSLVATNCIGLSAPSRLIPRGEATTTTLPFPVDETLWIVWVSPSTVAQLNAAGIGLTRGTSFVSLPPGLRDIQGNAFQGPTVQQAATADCSACPAGSYGSRTCTDTADRVCSPCTVCGTGFFAATACSATRDTACLRKISTGGTYYV
ncbi:hypothetical protein, variant [Aphanomyces astaci]|uniref:TNFR-Cys domain-containing protein n=1 Tax=Aphanomyces astaci TaxID=112090 RepID=W4GQM1_APHAT|nr:hypothetical protein, variant [Aphanomyces astaci]ETV82002.1 hypothetical protein, variant [Aphanomyces astaci]|eukprot:XP_009828739.1 hypothetical protein, variant [Aphanomyces astaci]